MALYSASTLLLDTTVYLLDFQEMGEVPKSMQKPVIVI